MSAFIVEDGTINQIVSLLAESDSRCRLDTGWYIRRLKEAGYDLSNGGAEKLGQDMFSLNVRSIEERYGKGGAAQFRDLDYVYRSMTTTRTMQAYKSLGCWLYQCCEGTVPESSLYKLMQEFKGAIAEHFVAQMPEYGSATWG